MAELIFEVTQDADGGYCAECLTHDFFTEADTWEDLRTNVRKPFAPISSTEQRLNEFVCILSATRC